MYVHGGIALVAVLIAGITHAQVGLDVDEEQRVREYFADTPVMIEIARCESKFRQYTDAGNPLYGGAGGAMVGVFQIYTSIHQEYARSVLGYDITTLDGNIGYAKYLYQTEGTQPWMSSFPCWGDSSSGETDVSNAVVVTSDRAITANLSFGVVHPQVLTLQRMLNQQGFTLATDGPGSPGQETEKFGFLTREGVQKFQCATIDVCGGDEYTTGYGFVGPRTRAALATAGTVASAAPTPTESAAQSTEDISGQQAEIERLQAQIAELTRVLGDLLAKQEA